MSPSISVFDLPHVLKSISSFLTLHNLTRCVLVNKAWSQYFLPSLYRSLYFAAKATKTRDRLVRVMDISAYALAQATSLQYVQTIKTELLSDALWEEQETTDKNNYDFSRLRRLSLYWYITGFWETENTLPRALAFISRHHNLYHFELCIKRTSVESFELVAETIKHHPGLRSVCLVLSVDASSAHFEPLFESISNLESFEMLVWGKDLLSPTASSIHAKEVHKQLIRQGPTRIRRLALTIEDPEFEQVLLPGLIAHCPRLETLEVHSFNNLTHLTVQELADQIRDHCSSLRRLKIGTRSNKDILELVKASSSSPCTVGGGDGLESLNISLGGHRFQSSLTEAIVPAHAQTLTSLVLQQRDGVDLETTLDVLFSCPRLETFKVLVLLNMGPPPSTRVPSTESRREVIQQQIRRPWTCLGMKDLLISTSTDSVPAYCHNNNQDHSSENIMTFDDVITQKMRVGDGSFLDQLAEHLFTQIGRLRRLKILEFWLWKCPMTTRTTAMEHGYLSRLAGLRELRECGLTYCAYDEPEHRGLEEEAHWIVQHWPVIARLQGFQGKSMLEFRDIVQKARPGIDIVNAL